MPKPGWWFVPVIPECRRPQPHGIEVSLHYFEILSQNKQTKESKKGIKEK
jgi:hypothetical protein